MDPTEAAMHGVHGAGEIRESIGCEGQIVGIKIQQHGGSRGIEMLRKQPGMSSTAGRAVDDHIAWLGVEQGKRFLGKHRSVGWISHAIRMVRQSAGTGRVPVLE